MSQIHSFKPKSLLNYYKNLINGCVYMRLVHGVLATIGDETEIVDDETKNTNQTNQYSLSFTAFDFLFGVLMLLIGWLLFRLSWYNSCFWDRI